MATTLIPSPIPTPPPTNNTHRSHTNASTTATVNTIRFVSVNTLKDLVKNDRYATELERQIYHKSNRPMSVVSIRGTYYRIYNRIVYALKVNGKWLMHTFTPAELVLIDDLTLVSNTPLAENWTQYQREIKQYKNLLSGQSGHEDDNETGFRCPKFGCENTKRFEIHMKQTRSADEPMTSFIKCCECNTRFKR